MVTVLFKKKSRQSGFSKWGPEIRKFSKTEIPEGFFKSQGEIFF